MHWHSGFNDNNENTTNSSPRFDKPKPPSEKRAKSVANYSHEVPVSSRTKSPNQCNFLHKCLSGILFHFWSGRLSLTCRERGHGKSPSICIARLSHLATIPCCPSTLLREIFKMNTSLYAL